MQHVYCHRVVYCMLTKIACHSGYFSEWIGVLVGHHDTYIHINTQTPRLSRGDTLILYVNHVRLSCQNGAAFQYYSLANQMIAVCHGNNLQGDMEEKYNRDGQTCKHWWNDGRVRWSRKQSSFWCEEKEETSKSPAWKPALKLHTAKIFCSEMRSK